MNNKFNYIGNKNKRHVIIPDKKFNFKKLLICLLIIVLVAVIGIVFYLKSNEEKIYKKDIIYGTWNCNDGSIKLFIDSDHFLMEVISNTSYVEAYYNIDNISEGDNDKLKYDLTVTATKRYVNSEELEGDYSTKYQISISEDNTNEMTMINSITDSYYKCKK